jgi:hypothetical protein
MPTANLGIDAEPNPSRAGSDAAEELGLSRAEALDKPVEAYGAHRPAALRNEYVGVRRVLPPQLA